MKCKADVCEREVRCREYCAYHYNLYRKNGILQTKSKRSRGEGCIIGGYLEVRKKGAPRKRVHVLLAEKALGRPLPKKARVHHADCNKLNNDPANLVICPDDAYHLLLHQRIYALEACGNPNYLKCRFCKQYDDPKNLAISKHQNSGYHRECDNKWHRDKSARKKQEVSK